jgi:DNA-binding YbaB/EbfC family protein
MNMQEIMRQAQKMQKKMAEVQEQAGNEVVEAAVGGGMVKVTMNGRQEMLSIEIEKEIIDPSDPDMLQDLVVAAVNEAIKRAQALMQEKMSSVTGGLNLPGMF